MSSLCSPKAIPAMSEGSTAPSSALTTPDASYDDASNPRGMLGDETPKAASRVYTSIDAQNAIDENDGEKRQREASDKAKMPPPPIPVSGGQGQKAPRMARMPSLSQITEHLLIPSPGAAASPITPPKLSLSTNLPTPSPGSASFVAMSPSSRLKLPASAMTRSRSGSGGSAVTLASLGMTRRNSHSPSAGSSNSLSPQVSATASVDNHTLTPPPGLSKSQMNVSPNTPTTTTTDSTAAPVSPKSGSIASPAVSASLQREGSREYVQGYKDVPSLAAIRQRMSISSMAAITGSEGKELNGATVPGPNGETRRASDEKDLDAVETLLDDGNGKAIESSIATGVMSGKGVHPLRHAWTLYYDAKGYTPDKSMSAAKDGGTGLGHYEESLLHVGSINTVESFARHMNNLRLPSRLSNNANYHLFKGRIRPMWEDPANAKGGKWVILFRSCPGLIDIAWANLTMALVGEMLDDQDMVCGIVASSRPKVDRVQIWTRGRDDVEKLNALGRRAWDVMGLERGEAEHVSLEYQYNSSDSHPPANTFFHISFTARNFTASPSTPSRLGASGSLPSLNLPPTPSTALRHGQPSHLHQATRHLPPHLGTSPLQNSNRQEFSPSPSVSPTPSPRLGTFTHALPKTPDGATIKASMGTSPSMPSMAGGGGGGGQGMKRLGSGQGATAFAGPMGMGQGMGLGIKGGLSPRMQEARLTPPSPRLVPAQSLRGN